MKIFVYTFFLLFNTTVNAQSFTAGNIAVFVANNAGANNTSAGIVELKPGMTSQAAVTSRLIDSTSTSGLRFSGSATSTGYMANSNDGTLLCFTGHNSTNTTSNANTLNARGAGTYNATGNYTLATTYTGNSSNQTRCATTLNNTNWYIADQGGLYTNGSTAASPTGNFRGVKSFGGTVYIGSASSTTTVIQVSIVSAPSGGTVTGLPGLTNNANLQDFYLISSGSNGTAYDVLYVLSATSNSAGTITKYSLVNNSWTSNGSYTTAFGGFGLAAQKNGSGATLFVSTGLGALSGNSVLQLADANGYNTAINITTANNIILYTAAAGSVIKGVAFAPVTPVVASVMPSPTTLNFPNTPAGGTSTGQSVSLTASNLTPASGSLTVAAPNAHFQVSNDGGTTWVASTTVAYSNGGSTIGGFQVRFTPQSIAAQSGNVSISGGGLASAATVMVIGTGISPLVLAFSAATTPLLNPPAVSSTINDATDPAQQTGIIVSIANNGTPVTAANYTLTASSSNTTVLPNANILVTAADGQATIKINPVATGYANVTLSVTSGGNTSSIVINYAVSMPSPNSAGTHWHTSTADASAAIALDDTYMITCDDERNLLFVHNRNLSGLPVKIFDYNQNNALSLTDNREVDTEAGVVSPTTAGKVYWMGSMSNSSTSFADRPSRNRVFATTVSGTGANTTFANAGFYAGLRQQLITWGDNFGYNFSASAAAGKDPKLADGFNVEGMVFGPDNTTLYVGFRAPLVPTANRTKAVIAPVQVFETFFNNGNPVGTPVIGSPIELDLGGRGIRDIIRLTNGNYLILAGSSDGVLNPAVYSWTGLATDAAIALTDYNVAALNIEGAMQVTNNGQPVAGKIQFISDNGDDVFYGDGVAAKDLPQNNYKKFRSDVVTASTILPLRFVSFMASGTGDKTTLQWQMALPDQSVRFVVYRSADGRNFTAIKTIDATAGSGTYNYTDGSASGKLAYYRILAMDASGKAISSAVRFINKAATGPVFSLYPNPVSGDAFTLFSTEAGTKTVSIFTGNGTLYKMISLSGTVKEISTAGWPKGVYNVQVIHATGIVITRQLVVN